MSLGRDEAFLRQADFCEALVLVRVGEWGVDSVVWRDSIEDAVF